jgi:outer membrane lipoprotein-sorting protein
MKIFNSIFFCIILLVISTSNGYSDSKIIQLIQDQWNSIESLGGKFKQQNYDGTLEYGSFFMQKPYQSYFHYDEKNEHIVTGKFLISIVDQDQYVIESYPIYNHPLKRILSKNLILQDDLKIDNFYKANEMYVLTSYDEDDQKMVKLFFNSNNLDLKKWEIINEFDQKTSLEFTMVSKNISIDQNKFVVLDNNQ